MCIIAVYRNGKRPTPEKIKTMMDNNADGAGIAWNDGKSVHFKKGFSTPEEAFKYAEKISTKARDIVFHARIATSGGISPAKCHPFPLTEKNKVLDATSGGGIVPLLFHNGVLPVDLERGLSDSQIFAKYSLAPLYRADARGLKAGVYDELIELASRGSRLALMFPDAVHTFGVWHEDGGALYSNYTYKKTEWRKPLYSYGDYEWEYNEDGRLVCVPSTDCEGGAKSEK